MREVLVKQVNQCPYCKKIFSTVADEMSNRSQLLMELEAGEYEFHKAACMMDTVMRKLGL